MVKYYTLSFRINYIIGTILNLLSFAAAYFWYHPVRAQKLRISKYVDR